MFPFTLQMDIRPGRGKWCVLPAGNHAIQCCQLTYGPSWLNQPRCLKTRMASPLILSLPFLFPSALVAGRHSVGEFSSGKSRANECRGERILVFEAALMDWDGENVYSSHPRSLCGKKGWTKMARDSWLNLKFEVSGSSPIRFCSFAPRLHCSRYAVIHLAWPLQSLPFT